MTQTRRLAVGLMSGTSMDAVDAALVEVEGKGGSMRPKVRAFYSLPYPAHMAKQLARAHELATPELARLHWNIGAMFAAAASEVMARARTPPRDVTAIGSHGQTVYHDPPRSTLQIGEAALVRERTGRPTVADFRAADLAAGGQGAPLVPWVDWLLYRERGRTRLAQNLGGIGNVTRVTHEKAGVLAFDTGPANMLIDRTARELSGGREGLDRDGALAGAGKPDRAIVERWLDHEFFRSPPPKSTGRELFGESFYRRTATDTAGLSPEGRMATVTWFTAASIAAAYRDFIGKYDEVILSGGGAANRTLVSYIEELLAPVPVVPCDRYGIRAKEKEALAFAMLALAALDGIPANIPAATGARREVVLGKILP
ncbi:MAG: anhydro-N-acetylmuramic acid kinase [Planctomycetes bacterium]|nr:anhydro-N-acetylmuramic acid kinase [Planctomycetota bacterium]